jgi:IclR family mhp operon transcriptional activator
MKKSRAESTKVLERGLMVLENITQHGLSSVQEISARTSLSRQAVYRIMESLSRTGFVYRRSQREAYRPTIKALRLAATLPDDAIIGEIARPLMVDITKKTGWPVLLGHLDDIDLAVIETTDVLVKRDLKRIDSGDRMPQFRRAAGVICKAFVDPAEAQRINKRTQQKYAAELLTHSEAYRDSLLSRVRKQAYVVFEPLRSKESSVAVPVVCGDGFVMGLELRFLPASVKPDALKDDFIPRLQEAALTIGAQVAEIKAGRAPLHQIFSNTRS